jgi:hypothetical protein
MLNGRQQVDNLKEQVRLLGLWGKRIEVISGVRKD